MFQYYILEIVKAPETGYSHNVFWTFDADKDLARRKAEAKAYEILQVAAVDQNYLHSVTVLADDGFQIMSKVYRNVPEPQPEPEPKQDNG